MSLLKNAMSLLLKVHETTQLPTMRSLNMG
jgi:hypothetical protein